MDEIEQIQVKMLESFKTTGNWLNTYKELLNSENWDEYFPYSSSSMFPEIFIYYMVKNKVSIESFNEVMKHIYHHTEKNEIAILLQNFFYDRDVYLNSRDYRDIEDDDISSKISYLFVHWDKVYETKEDVLHIQFNQEYLPYLISLITQIPQSKISVIDECRFHYFLAEFKENINELTPIIELAKTHKNFLIRAKSEDFIYENRNFFDNLFNTISESNLLYQSEKSYNYLNKMLPNLNELMVKSMTFDKSSLNGNILRFMLKHDVDMSFLKMLNKDFEQQLNKARKDDKLDKYSSTIRNCISTIQTYCPQVDFKFDVNLIDINKLAVDNIIYLALLEVKLKQGNTLPMSKEIIDYMTNIIEYEKENKAKNMTEYINQVTQNGNANIGKLLDNNENFLYLVKSEKMKEQMEKIYQYQKMNEDLPEKETNSKPKL